MSSALGKLQKQQLLAAHAHRMRVAPSEPERLLWAVLRGSQLGVRFQRQVVLQGYIVDFFAPAARLVVEGTARSIGCGWARTSGGTRPLQQQGLLFFACPRDWCWATSGRHGASCATALAASNFALRRLVLPCPLRGGPGMARLN